jgi:antitoxin (DNA-binding transcriptional repressor) of toxin-antitoxin stability system
MITAGIKELKNQLSRHIALVKKGDDVLITERGRVIARVIREDSRRNSLRQALQVLVLKGQVVMPTREINRDIAKPVKLQGKPVSEIVVEDRR